MPAPRRRKNGADENEDKREIAFWIAWIYFYYNTGRTYCKSGGSGGDARARRPSAQIVRDAKTTAQSIRPLPTCNGQSELTSKMRRRRACHRYCSYLITPKAGCKVHRAGKGRIMKTIAADRRQRSARSDQKIGDAIQRLRSKAIYTFLSLKWFFILSKKPLRRS